MKSEFITTAAHELRTPMSTVLGYSELLQTRNLSEAQQKEMVEAIYRQAQSIVYLLEELLDVALIESRADKIFNLRPTDIGTLLTSTASGFMMTGDTRKVALKPLPELPKVMMDAEKITQALKNCLSNAFKFSSKDSEVTLEARLANPAEVAINITDRGIGMNKEVMERMFEKFYRGDTSGHIPGTGLGMTLVKQIMDYHRGRIEVESTPGNGATITLFLRVKP
jgi:signal transduction histidine kinase